MRLRTYLLLLLLLVPTLISCSSGATPQPADLKRPPLPTATANAGVVVGTVIGTTTKTPIKRTPVYLAKIFWDDQHKNAAFALDIGNSPAAQTDENGYFVISNVEPAEYALVVGDYFGRNDVLRESNGNARLFQPEAGKVLDIGSIEMSPEVQMP